MGDCSRKPPGCSPTKDPGGSRCQCWDPQGKSHAYDCDKKDCNCPKPKICEGKKLRCDMTSPELKARRAECKKKGTVVSRTFKTRWYWSNSTCQCEKKSSKSKEVVKDTFKCMKNGMQMRNGKPTKIPCAAYD